MTDEKESRDRLGAVAAGGNGMQVGSVPYCTTDTNCVSIARTTLRALLDGTPVNTNPAECGSWSEAVQALLDAQANGGRVAVRQAFDALVRDDLALAALVAGDDDRDYNDSEAVSFPALPDGVLLDPTLGEGAGEWIDTYIGYARQVSPMTPVMFHESAALWLGSVAIARRLKLPMAFGDVYPNLFIAWLAPTTLWNKTTALDVARKLARRLFPHLLAPQDTTVESFLSDLAGVQPLNLDALPKDDQDLWREERNFCAQRGLVLDELSGLMAGAGRDYNVGLIEAMLRFYDNDPLYARSTVGKGRVVVKKASLAILGASTPAAMSCHMASERLWAMGWWARFALLAPETDRPEWQVAAEASEPPGLADRLHQLYERLPVPTWPEPPPAQSVLLGEGVFEAWQGYNKATRHDLIGNDLDERLWGTYGRLPVQALKVATILATLDWCDGNAPTIELAHLARAVGIVETWRASAHRALVKVTVTEFDRLQRRIIRQLSRHEPQGATLRNLYKSIKGKSPEEIEMALGQLQKVGMVEVIDVSPGKNGGRPTKRYRLTR